MLQICFGTVYAWSFFQTMLVHQSGWTHTETAWAFSIAIFSLGTSAAWAGSALGRLGTQTARPRRQPDVLGRLRHRKRGAVAGPPAALLRGLRRHRRRGHRTRLRNPGGHGGEVVSGPQGLGNRHRRHGLRCRRAASEQRSCTLPRGAHRGRSFPGLPVARDHIRLHSASLQPGVERPGAGEGSRSRPDARGRRGTGIHPALPDVQPVHHHVDRVLLQHRRGHLRHQLSVGVAPGGLGAGGPHRRARGAGGVRSHADRRPVRCATAWAGSSGACCPTASAG